MTTLTGRLTRGDGTGDSGVKIIAQTAWTTYSGALITDTPLTAVTDLNGAFAMPNLIPGRWVIDLLTSGAQQRKVLTLPDSGTVDLSGGILTGVYATTYGATY